MSLSAGTTIGHYDVTALLGEGGMGQVWQATDTQLNRQVALKILPDAFAADPDRGRTRAASRGTPGRPPEGVLTGPSSPRAGTATRARVGV